MRKNFFRTLLVVLVSGLLIATMIGETISRYMGIPEFIIFALLLSIIGFGVFSLVSRCLYRPRENHLGVVYRFGRFHRFINPYEWSFLIPYFETIKFESSLSMHTSEVMLRRVELMDGASVDAHFKVFFKTDLRLTDLNYLAEVLAFEGQDWPIAIIKTGLEDIARNQIFLEMSLDRLRSLRKNHEIKRLFSRELASRVIRFGILINQEYGVMLVNVRPIQNDIEAIKKFNVGNPGSLDNTELLVEILTAIKQIGLVDLDTAQFLELATKIIEEREYKEKTVNSLNLSNLQLAGDSTTDAPLPDVKKRKK